MSKKKYLILTIVILLATAVFMGIWLHGHFQPTADVREYNTYATAQAYSSGLISSQDILILHTIKRTPGGDSSAEFYIYRIPSGVSAEDYLGMQADQIGDALEFMGNASCTFAEDNPAMVRNLTALYLR